VTALSTAARRGVLTLSERIDGVGSVRAIELLRVAAGPLTIAHLWPFLSSARAGLIYSDRFYEPYVSWYPEVPRNAYLVLLWLTLPAAVCLSLGIGTRLASSYTAGFVAYNLFLSRNHFWHNRAFLLVLLVGLALLPLGRRWSLGALVRMRRGRRRLPDVGRLWPVLLMRFEVATVYMASGLSKLVDPDWWGGTVTRLRVVQWRDVAAAGGVPDGILDLVESEGFHVWFAKVAVLTEILIALGLLTRRARMGAIWVAVWFHVSIEFVASVQVFSFAALAALVIWVTPSARDRTVVVRGGTNAARVIVFAVRYLDWFGRFRLSTERSSGASVTLVDRDGSEMHGAAATRVILSRLPVTFVPVAPFNLAGARRFWDRLLSGSVA
jgi:hypothetical protein